MQKTQETWFRSLGQEYPLKEEMATYSSILARKILDIGAWQAKVLGVTKSPKDFHITHLGL